MVFPVTEVPLRELDGLLEETVAAGESCRQTGREESREEVKSGGDR